MKPSAFLFRCVLPIATWYVTACNPAPKQISNTISFKAKLSEYGLFKADMSVLAPQKGVELMQIAAPLFTDYAEKQRLLKIPAGKQMVLTGDGLPVFPDGTIIAKTFYYSNKQAREPKIIETRLLILGGKKWNAATYQWNEQQTDAQLLTKGAVIPTTFEDMAGTTRKIQYKIPAQDDCASCHRLADELTPIGPKARNLNVAVDAEGIRQNQIAYWMKKGLFTQAEINAITSIPNYHDTSAALPMRARAYLEMNCAHCHQPGGSAGSTSLNLSYSADYQKTGIGFNKENMIIRMATMGTYHMPKTGTTILDGAGVKLVKDYIMAIDAAPSH